MSGLILLQGTPKNPQSRFLEVLIGALKCSGARFFVQIEVLGIDSFDFAPDIWVAFNHVVEESVLAIPPVG